MRRPATRDGESSSIWNPRACSGASSSAMLGVFSGAVESMACENWAGVVGSGPERVVGGMSIGDRR
jgi:hypothetical protein